MCSRFCHICHASADSLNGDLFQHRHAVLAEGLSLLPCGTRHVCTQMLHSLRAVSSAIKGKSLGLVSTFAGRCCTACEQFRAPGPLGDIDTACWNIRLTKQMPETLMPMIRFQCNLSRSSAIIPCQRTSLPFDTALSLEPKYEAALLIAAPRLCQRWRQLNVQR